MTAPVMIMAGGTGGHVFPALAVAAELRRQQVPVIWLGTRRGLESRVVPAAGIPIECLSLGGLRGHGWRRWLSAPYTLLRAAWQAWRVMQRHHPRSVLGMGGFAAGPGGVVAWLSRCPLLIHEQNAVPGLTNRLLSRLARRVLQAFPDAFEPRLGAELTGNPVRADLLRLATPRQRLSLDAARPLRLLVFGGSQGARALNEILPQALALLPPGRIEVRHQCGRGRADEVTAAYAAVHRDASVEAFIEDMAAAYAWADLALTRSGAMTVAELSAVGLAALLVPFPYAVDDHQTRNAEFLTRVGAAELLPESSLDAKTLAARLVALADDRARLLQMAEAARSQARPEAAPRIAALCLEVAR